MEPTSIRRLLFPLGLFLLSLTAPGCNSIMGSEEQEALSSTRDFEFSFEVTIPNEVSENPEPIRLWVPVPVSDSAQHVELLNSPEGVSWSTPDEHGNRNAYMMWEMGMPKQLTWTWRVRRSQDFSGGERGDRFLVEDQVMGNYLDADLGVPVRGAAQDIAHELALSSTPKHLPRAIYDRVLADMRFEDQGQGPGHGSTDWAISQGFGDSTDYQAFFISTCRASKIPARFQVGYLLPLQRGNGLVDGRHSWTHYYRQGAGWFPLDLAAADLDPMRADFYFGHLSTNRISVSCGRDIMLSPLQAGGALSFFNQPYAEQGGLDVQLDVEVRFQDLPTLSALPSKKDRGYWP